MHFQAISTIYRKGEKIPRVNSIIFYNIGTCLYTWKKKLKVSTYHSWLLTFNQIIKIRFILLIFPIFGICWHANSYFWHYQVVKKFHGSIISPCDSLTSENLFSKSEWVLSALVLVKHLITFRVLISITENSTRFSQKPNTFLSRFIVTDPFEVKVFCSQWINIYAYKHTLSYKLKMFMNSPKPWLKKETLVVDVTMWNYLISSLEDTWNCCSQFEEAHWLGVWQALGSVCFRRMCLISGGILKAC